MHARAQLKKSAHSTVVGIYARTVLVCRGEKILFENIKLALADLQNWCLRLKPRTNKAMKYELKGRLRAN